MNETGERGAFSRPSPTCDAQRIASRDRPGRQLQLAACLALSLMLSPLAASSLAEPPPRSKPASVRRQAAVDSWQTTLLYGIAAAYALAFGGCAGSFLNVVIYRLPAGLNLVHPGSRCPVCLTPIKLSDNIPVLSWLRLRGRCRACAVSIPPRYFLVEATVALLFLLLMQVEIVSGGANIPFRKPLVMTGLISLHWPDMVVVLRLTLYHAWLLTTLLAAALIRHDRHPVPRSLFIAGFVVAIGAALIWPDVRAVPTYMPKFGVPIGLSSWVAVWQAILGAMTGAACGLLASLAVGSRESARRHEVTAIVGGGALSGAFLGWQAAVSVIVLASLARLTLSLLALLFPRAGHVSGPALIGLASLVQIVCWRMLEDLPYWPGIRYDGKYVYIAALLGIVALALLTRFLARWKFARADRLARRHFESTATLIAPE